MVKINMSFKIQIKEVQLNMVKLKIRRIKVIFWEIIHKIFKVQKITIIVIYNLIIIHSFKIVVKINKSIIIIVKAKNKT